MQFHETASYFIKYTLHRKMFQTLTVIVFMFQFVTILMHVLFHTVLPLVYLSTVFIPEKDSR